MAREEEDEISGCGGVRVVEIGCDGEVGDGWENDDNDGWLCEDGVIESLMMQKPLLLGRGGDGEVSLWRLKDARLELLDDGTGSNEGEGGATLDKEAETIEGCLDIDVDDVVVMDGVSDNTLREDNADDGVSGGRTVFDRRSARSSCV